MSYEPEIQVSRDRAVLGEFKNPDTNAVSWRCAATPFIATPLEIAEKIRCKSAGSTLNLLTDWYRSSALGFLNDIVHERVRKIKPDAIACLPSVKTNFYGAGTKPQQGSLGIPHVDMNLYIALLSINPNLLNIYLFPREFVGEPDKDNKILFPDADFNKAVMTDGVSLTLMNADEQVHAGYEEIPPDKGDRIVVETLWQFSPSEAPKPYPV